LPNYTLEQSANREALRQIGNSPRGREKEGALWAVDSDATVKFITGAMREMTRDAKVGRAKALRRSLLTLIDKGDTREAHPANWAPFIVVGEGARVSVEHKPQSSERRLPRAFLPKFCRP
jgi:hypothetical protein